MQSGWWRTRMKYMNKKGAILHIGFGVLLLTLVVVYIAISLGSPDTAVQINQNLASLSQAAQGVAP